MSKSLRCYLEEELTDLGIFGYSGCVTFGDYFCACLEKKVRNQMFVSETVEETKHIPTLPHAQKSLQKLGGLLELVHSLGLPGGKHGKSSQLYYFYWLFSLLPLFPTSSTSESPLSFFCMANSHPVFKTLLMCRSLETLANGSIGVCSSGHLQLCSYSARQVNKKRGREKEGSQIEDPEYQLKHNL